MQYEQRGNREQILACLFAFSDDSGQAVRWGRTASFALPLSFALPTLQGIGPSQALALGGSRGQGPTGGLDALAGLRPRCAALPVLAQRLVLAELGLALGILFGVAVGGVRLKLETTATTSRGNCELPT